MGDPGISSGSSLVHFVECSGVRMGVRPVAGVFFYTFIKILWFLTMAKNWNSVVKNFRNFRKSLRRIWFRTWAFGVHN